MNGMLFSRAILLYYPLLLGADQLYKLNGDSLLENERDVWFESLSKTQLTDHWSHDDGSSLSEKFSKLQQFEVEMLVDVKLIAFDSSGHRAFSVQESELLKYLRTSVISDPDKIFIKGNQNHTMPFHVRYIFQVSKAKESLTSRIRSAVNEYLDNHMLDYFEPGQSTITVSVPYNIVNDIIREDHASNSLSYSIYILNLPKPKPIEELASDDGKFPVINYVYSQSVDEDENESEDGESSLPECKGVNWVGRDRYVWIDLTAGPATFGPQTSGDGIFISEFSLPNLDRLFGQNDAKQVRTSVAKTHEFLAELAAVIKRTCQYLITPTMGKWPISYTSRIRINLVLIHDEHVDLENNGIGTEWDEIIEELQDLSLAGQSVEVATHALSFSECELCVAAYTHSLNSRAADSVGGIFGSQVHQYLDSVEMHDWLEHFENNFWGIKAEATAESTTSVRVITAFIYDLGTEYPLLLDQLHQAVSFKDIVIGIQTQSDPVEVDYSCNDEVMKFNPSDSSRAVLAALLQTAWGIMPTSTNWNQHHSKPEINYMWTIGLTPFGFFSQSKRLSFSQRDAAARNIVWGDLNETMGEIFHLNKHWFQFEVELSRVLSASSYLTYIQRWNVLSFKIKKAQHFLSLNNFNQSLFYIRSAKHDVIALNLVVDEATDQLQPIISCNNPHDLSFAQKWLQRISEIVEGLFLLSMLGITIVLTCFSNTWLHNFLGRLFFKEKKY